MSIDYFVKEYIFSMQSLKRGQDGVCASGRSAVMALVAMCFVSLGIKLLEIAAREDVG